MPRRFLKNFDIQADFVNYHFDSYFMLLDEVMVHIRLNILAAQPIMIRYLDRVGEDESHELIGLVDVIGCMIASYDEENYNQYYGAVSKEEIIQIRNLSNQTGGVGIACVTGLKDWEELAPKYNFKSLLTNDAQIHFLSCVVGLGIMGESFTKGIANLLLSGDGARVQTSVNFGLGDWSMSEGMGFWDYQNDSQLKRDNNNYPKNRTDRQEMQKGSIRIAGLLNGIVTTGLISNRDFMFADERDPGTLTSAHWLETTSEYILPKSPVPQLIRIPGTKFKAKVSKK